MPESNPPVLTPNRNRAVQSKTFSTPTPVAVEKVHFPENGRNLGDRKCLGKPRKPFAGLPSAKFFRPVLRDRVFQQPHLISTVDFLLSVLIETLRFAFLRKKGQGIHFNLQSVDNCPFLLHVLDWVS